MASVISHFTSFEYQRQLTEKWLDDDGSNAGSKKIINSERKEKLLDELDALKNTTSVRKLRAELAE